MKTSIHSLLVLFVCIGGCVAAHRQVQTYMAEDPLTGERAIYRVSIEGKGIGAVKYYAHAAYLPQSAIDLYSGKIPESLAELDALDPTGKSPAHEIMDHWRELLTQQMVLAKEHWKDKVLEGQQRLELKKLAAENVADANLSVADLQSIAESGQTGAYQFRKLVYFVSTKPLTVRNFEAEIGEIENSVGAIAAAMAKAKEARQAAAKQRQEQRRQRIGSLKTFLESNPDPKNPMTLFQLMSAVGGVQ